MAKSQKLEIRAENGDVPIDGFEVDEDCSTSFGQNSMHLGHCGHFELLAVDGLVQEGDVKDDSPSDRVLLGH